MTSDQPWHLVVPVKGGNGAKSRLQPPEGVDRAALALAFAADCLAAVVSGMPRGRVFVVTSHPDAVALAAGLGARVVADPGGGLNAAVAAGRDAALASGAPLASASTVAIATTHADASSPVPVAFLLGDLPALRPGDLTEALPAAAAYPLAFVPDADGTGTVLLTATDGRQLEPRFGEGSAARHEAAGHTRLDLDLPRLRTDVDDSGDLEHALALGVGPATAAILARRAH
ncbi:2-phospho-L-lactate guanylyltransferase [Knoellia koreensis]|uniref:Phosphoenolpyruvate guanylyltransferase n=1 Tax=Knoellia koreensis TaxID=2730921 RepID=A0A849H7C0_9MICO|nr:2-phospho-L-lactate guanylyltransferase [Knoellia sp. DB2414S]NNM45656.1 2-phospho-L-lactate guanylyltransferase [Knoellia sp. DB2414S]